MRRRNIHPILTLVLVVGCLPVMLSASIIEVPLAERVREADLVVEGTILSRMTFRGWERGLIHTAWHIRVSKVFKGGVVGDDLWLVTEGGLLGEEELIVTPGMLLREGKEGLFLLRRSGHVLPESVQPARPAFVPVTRVQAFIQYDRVDGTANDIFRVFGSIDADLYAAITALTGREWSERSGAVGGGVIAPDSRSGRPRPAATITGFSPATLRAGVDDVLTIYGSGFGSSYSGSANVQFTSAYGSIDVSIASGYVRSWTDTQISIAVPSDAATGLFRVTGTGGAQVTSSSQLGIDFSVLNAYSGSTSPVDMYNSNGVGGYTFTMHSTFAANSAAAAAFQRAVQTWRCGVYANLAINPIIGNAACHDIDGINNISFDNNCSLGSGVLGATYMSRTTCLSGVYMWRWKEFDIVFSTSYPWYIGTGSVPSGSYDFETVVLHELGHVVSLDHVRPSGHLMFFALGTGQVQRTLNPTSAQAGGVWTVNRSRNHNGCGATGMVPLNASNCALSAGGPAPTPGFSSTSPTGCAPLAVTFTDASTPTPTSWEWDVDNNGTFDYFTSSPTHTYTQPGSYSVRLRVSNATGSNTITRTSYVTVRPKPVVNAGTDRTVCGSGSVTIGGLASGGSAPYLYRWNPQTGLDDPTAAMPTASPLSTTVYTLTVTDATGCATTDAVTITVHVPPTANAGSDIMLNPGQTGVIGTYASNGQPPYTYRWEPTTGLSNASAAMPTVTATVTTLYTVTVTDARGCTSTDQVNVIVSGPAPTIAASGPTSFCEGESVVLTASAGYVSYLWSPGGERTRSITVRQSGSYQVTGTDGNGIPINSLAVQVDVTPRPVAQVSPSGNVQVCQGSTVTLTAGGNHASYQWSNGQTTRSIVVGTSGSFSVIVRNSLGCADTSDLVHVTVTTATASITPGGAITLCGDDSVTLDAGGGYSTYVWSTGARTQRIVVKSAGNYSVQVTTSAGCQGFAAVSVSRVAAPQISPPGPIGLCEAQSIVLDAGAGYAEYTWSTGEKTQTITVRTAGSYAVTTRSGGCVATSRAVEVTNVAPPRPLVSPSGPTEFCEGGSVTLVAPPGYRMYAWSTGESERAIVVSRTGTYAVSVLDSSGCMGISPPVAVVVHEKPMPVVQPGDAVLCESDSLVLDAGAGYLSYAWSDGTSQRTLVVRRAGVYTVDVVDVHGCGGRSAPVRITTRTKPPAPVITRTGDVLLSSKAQYYQWYRNGVAIPGANNQFLVVTENGVYTVEVRLDLQGCASMSAPYDMVTGVEVLPVAGDLSVYPDPTAGVFTIRMSMVRPEQVMVRVFSMLGVEVHAGRHEADGGVLHARIDLSSVPPGMYIVQLTTRDGLIVRRILKH